MLLLACGVPLDTRKKPALAGLAQRYRRFTPWKRFHWRPCVDTTRGLSAYIGLCAQPVAVRLLIGVPKLDSETCGGSTCTGSQRPGHAARELDYRRRRYDPIGVDVGGIKTTEM